MALNIGDSYLLSTGDTFCLALHNFRMQRKSQRTFWERVQEALRDKGLPTTQKHVADRILHISQPTVSDWNKPGGYPTLENAISLAQHLNVCVEWLFTERGPKRPIPEDPLAQKLWDMWPNIDTEAKGMMVGIAMSRVQPRSGDPYEKRA